MQNTSDIEKKEKTYSDTARSFIETTVKKKVPDRIYAEVIEHHWRWSEYRNVFSQSMKVWQELTGVYIGIEPDGTQSGWFLEKRKETCEHKVLSDGEIEIRAREIPQINLGMSLKQVDQVAIDDNRSYSVAKFDAYKNDGPIDVYVNHTTGEIMGVLYSLGENKGPVPIDDSHAKNAIALAWKQIKRDLKNRAGEEVSQQADEALKLIPKKALSDDSGRKIYYFGVWAFLSTADIAIDEKTGEIVSWYIESFQADAPECKITEEVALEYALPELRNSNGVQGPEIFFDNELGDENVSVYWWHEESGINIEGDQTMVSLNGKDGTIYSVSRKWRPVSESLLAAVGISADEALIKSGQVVSRDPGLPPGNIIGKCVIQVAEDEDRPSPVKDILVWKVGYEEPNVAGFTEVSVDLQSGDVVRITGW